MSYSFIDEGNTILKVIDNGRELLFKKVYCSTAIDGDYFILNAHIFENNIYRQEYKLHYLDSANPTAISASDLKTQVDAIIENYASSGAGVDTVTATSPITSSGGSNPNISSNVNKGKLIGRNSVTNGVMEEITVGSGLTLSGTTLSNTATPSPTGYYGAFQDNVTQTAVASNVGYAMILRTVDLSNGISVVTNGTNLTRITFANTGIYNLQFSSQFQNVDNAEHDVTIWLRLNGTDVAGSAGFVQVPKRKAAGAGNEGHVVVSWNYVLSVVAGQYYELMWSTTNHTNVTMEFYAGGSPPPSSASVILTVTQQSGIMAGTGITAINSLTGAAQTLGAGTSGTDFAISSAGTAHTFNLPTASATNRGALSSTDWSTFNNKLIGYGQFRKASRWYTNGMLPLGNASFGNVNGVIRYIPVLIDQDITITRVGINVNTVGPASSVCRVGIYTNDPTTTQPLTRIVDAGTMALDSTGVKSITGLSVALTKGLYWFAYFSNAASGTITGISSASIFDIKGQANIGPVGFAAFSQSLAFTTLPATAGTLTETNSGGTIAIYYYY